MTEFQTSSVAVFVVEYISGTVTCACVLLSPDHVYVPLFLTDVSTENQFDVLCEYLGLPTSFSVFFCQSDVLRHLVLRFLALLL